MPKTKSKKKRGTQLEQKKRAQQQHIIPLTHPSILLHTTNV